MIYRIDIVYTVYILGSKIIINKVHKYDMDKNSLKMYKFITNFRL